MHTVAALRPIALVLAFFAPFTWAQTDSRDVAPPTTALVNAQWFNGSSFESGVMYSVDGRFTVKKPTRIERTIDLAGLWIVPPFAEAHNHNLDGVSEERTRAALKKYLSDGVFYIKIQGNFPLDDALRARLPMNRPTAPDVSLAQTFLTASDGHPIVLHETVLLNQGYYPGLTKDLLRDKLYFALDSEADLDRKWPEILQLRPDFIKANLWASDEYEMRKSDPAYRGRKALAPSLLAKVVQKAHDAGLRVSVHVTNTADFRHALASGVDEIAHLPLGGPFPGDTTPTALSEADAQRAAEQRVVVVTTAALLARRSITLPGGQTLGHPDDRRAELRRLQIESLVALRDHGVALAIGSDSVNDSSVGEFEYLNALGVFDTPALLRIWTGTTAKAIFPMRQIGELKEGYEASFLALEGNPLDDPRNVRRIKVRFKQGHVLEP